MVIDRFRVRVTPSRHPAKRPPLCAICNERSKVGWDGFEHVRGKIDDILVQPHDLVVAKSAVPVPPGTLAVFEQFRCADLDPVLAVGQSEPVETFVPSLTPWLDLMQGNQCEIEQHCPECSATGRGRTSPVLLSVSGQVRSFGDVRYRVSRPTPRLTSLLIRVFKATVMKKLSASSSPTRKIRFGAA